MYLQTRNYSNWSHKRGLQANVDHVDLHNVDQWPLREGLLSRLYRNVMRRYKDFTANGYV